MEFDAYWSEFRSTWDGPQPAPEQYYDAFQFGSTPESADEMSRLVLDGTKTATSSLLWEYDQVFKKRPPQAGDFSIVLSGSRTPQCVIETTEVREMPFKLVDAQFAYDYGEGDRTLEWWRREIWDFYERECAQHGWTVSEDMPLICERFRVVYS